MKNSHRNIVIVILLLIVSLYYNYHEIVFKRPQSIHQWRQSDCASLALNYYQGDMSFFNPQTHNLTSDKGTTGNCCTSEVPVLYYAAALLYLIFGYHEFLFRGLNTMLFLLGYLFLFRLFYYQFKNLFWAIALTLFFFASPVLIFYGNNFLSNTTALSFVFIAWFYMNRFFHEKKNQFFYLSMLFFFIGSSLKITALFSVIAVFGIFLLGIHDNKKWTLKTLLDKKLYVFLILFFITSLWILYAHFYNKNHSCTYFSTTIFPLWGLDKQDILKVINNVRFIWFKQYFSNPAHIFLSLCFIILIVSFRKSRKPIFYTCIFILIEIVLYIILQFWTFKDHDYYTINMFILPVLLVLNTFEILHKHYPKLVNNLAFKIIFALFVLYNIYYAQKNLDKRYNKHTNKTMALHNITPYLRQVGVSQNDTIISIPDWSHVSLYLMNQKGWTQYTDANFNRGKRIRYNRDSAGIVSSIQKGAKYLIINAPEELLKDTFLQAFCNHLVGRKNDVLIFDLKNKQQNFSLQNKELQMKLFCGAENIAPDKKHFIGKPDSIFFENGLTQTNEYSHCGLSAIKLDASKPFGMTKRFKHVKHGESFIVTVWIKQNKKQSGSIIASSNTPKKYYNNENDVIINGKNIWQKIRLACYITHEMENYELVIYLFNPDKEPVYFDDLEIQYFKSAFE